MVTFTASATASTAAETNLFATVIADAYHTLIVNLTPMALGDIMIFRVYVYDTQGAAEILADTITVSGSQLTAPGIALYIPPYATQRFRVTVQRTLGSDRTFNWVRSQGG